MTAIFDSCVTQRTEILPPSKAERERKKKKGEKKNSDISTACSTDMDLEKLLETKANKKILLKKANKNKTCATTFYDLPVQ